MKTYLKLELKRTLSSWNVKIFIILILGLNMIPYLKELSIGYFNYDGITYYLKICDFGYFCYGYPVIASAIYSTSIIKDYRTGFLCKLLEIIDIKTYFKTKLLVNILTTSVVFIISNCLLIVYLIFFYGFSNIALDNAARRIFIEIYNFSPILYVILQVLSIVISAASFSTFMLGITTVTKRKFVAYILPVFYVVTTGILFQIWGLNNIIDFNIVILFAPLSDISSILSYFICNLIFLVLGILLVYKFNYKRAESLYIKKIKIS